MFKVETTEYNETFEKRLTSYNLVGLLDEVKKLKGMFFGSFTISTILDTEYPNADIDIAIKTKAMPYQAKNNLSDEEGDFMFKYGEPYSLFDNFIIKNLGGVLSGATPYPGNCISYKYILPNITLNIIRTFNNIEDYINFNSDLDICTTTFDGYKTKYVPNLLNKKANIIYNKDWGRYESCFKEFTESYSTCIFYRLFFRQLPDGQSFLRFYKYILRGFKINNLPKEYIDILPLIEKAYKINEGLNKIAYNYFMYTIFERLIDIKTNEKLIKGFKQLDQFGSPLQLNHYRYCGTVSKRRIIDPNQPISMSNCLYAHCWFTKYGEEIPYLNLLKKSYQNYQQMFENSYDSNFPKLK